MVNPTNSGDEYAWPFRSELTVTVRHGEIPDKLRGTYHLWLAGIRPTYGDFLDRMPAIVLEEFRIIEQGTQEREADKFEEASGGS